MQSETGFPSSHQLKSYVASKSRLKLAARAVLSADAGLLVNLDTNFYLKIITVTMDCSNCSRTTYIDIAADTSQSSTPSLCIVHLITSLGTLLVSNVFFQIHKYKIEFLTFHSCSCFAINIALTIQLLQKLLQ